MGTANHPFGQIELRDLRAFVAVAETGSISLAGKQISLTQSRVSQQIKGLERALGVELLSRVGRRVVLTPAGRVLHEHAIGVLQRLDAACKAVTGRNGSDGGNLRVGVVPACNTAFMPAILARFYTRYPSCSLTVEEISARLIERDLEGGKLDVGIGFLPHASPSLRYQRLLREKFAVVVPPGHPLSRLKRVPVSALHELPLVLLPDQYFMRQMIDQVLVRHRVKPRIAMEISSLPTIVHTVRAAGLCTLLPPFVVPSADASHLSCIELDCRQPFIEVGWMAPKGGERGALVEQLAAVAAEVIGEYVAKR